MDFPKKQQQSLIPRYLLQYLQDLQISHNDPTAPWGGGGGGGSYTAGDGIDITNDVISVDDTVALKTDLLDYVTTSELTTELSNYVTSTDLAAELLNYAELSDIPTNTSDLTNDSGFITSSALTGYATETWVTNQGYSTFSGSYNDLTNKPDLSIYELAADAFSGDYNDLINKPTIPVVPTNISAFTNDSGYITSSALTGYATKSWVTNQGYSTFSGSYNDLTNKPTIPTATSDLTNDSGFITNSVNNLTNYFDKTQIQNMFADTYAVIPEANVDPVDFPTAQTQTLTNLYVASSDTIYTVSGGGGGGGSSYSAGYGIDITNDVISVDDNVVALKIDIPDMSAYVTTFTDQNIIGIKTFVGHQLLRFKQSSSSNILGFTAYDNYDYEIGNLQIANRTVGRTNYNYVTLGNWSSLSTKSKVGFRIQPNSSTNSYNFVMPYGSNTEFTSNTYSTSSDTTIPCAFTDGTTKIKANATGLVDLSSLNLGSFVLGTSSGSYWTSLTINGITKSIPSGGGGGGTTVSGTNDGTNWTSITIGSDTYGIPSGGGGGGSSLAPQIYNFTSADWTGTNTNGYIHSNAMSREGLDLSTLSAGQTIKIDCIFVRPSNSTSYVHQFTLVIPDGTMATESTDTFQIPGTNQTNLQIEAWMQISNNRIGLFWSNSSQTRYISKVKVYPANA